MIRRPPARAASNAAAWTSGSGKAASGPARSQPVSPCRGSGPRSRPAPTFAAGSCERSAVQISRTTVPVRAAAAAGAGADRGDPVGQRQPAGDVEQRAPADLDVADAVGRLGLDQLGGDPLERLGVLHQRDRQVERAQQLGLVGARHRRDERRRHPGPVARRVDPARPGELERGVDPERAVEVEVELGLGHRLDQARGSGGAGRAVGRPGGRCPSRVDATTPAPCPPSSSPAPAASSAATPSRPCSPPATASSRSCRTPTAGEIVLGRLPAAQRASVEIRIGDVTRPDDARRRRSPASTPSSTSSPSRATSTAAPTSAWSTPRGRARSSSAMRDGRRPAARPHGRDGRRRTTRTSTTRAPRPRPRRSSATSGLDWTILKPSLQFGEGDGFFNIVAGLVRISPGHRPGPGRRLGPLPADPRRRRRDGRRPVARRPDDRRRRRSSSAARATGRTARSPARS